MDVPSAALIFTYTMHSYYAYVSACTYYYAKRMRSATADRWEILTQIEEKDSNCTSAYLTQLNILFRSSARAASYWYACLAGIVLAAVFSMPLSGTGGSIVVMQHSTRHADSEMGWSVQTRTRFN